MRHRLLTLPLILLISLLLSCTQEKEEAKSAKAELSSDAQKVVDYLLEDWHQQFSSTSIAMAMNNLGIAENDELRLQIGEYCRKNTDLAKNLKWWGANNYILSNEEKRIAKYFIHTFETEKQLPNLPEASKILAISENALQQRLAFMAGVGFLTESKNEELGYALVDGYDTWGGPLRYNFHSVTVAGQKPFDVW